MATCLWFDKQAEEAARFYCDLFPDSEISSVERAPGEMQKIDHAEIEAAIAD